MRSGRPHPKASSESRAPRASRGRPRSVPTRQDEQEPQDDSQSIIREMMDPYWSWRFMRANG